MHVLGFLVGRTVERISFDDGFTIYLDGGSISGASALKDASGRVYELSETAERSTFATGAASVIAQTITDATANNGTMRIRFDDGSEIVAFPDNRVESWEVSAGKNFVVCMPGGEVATWT